MHNNDHFANITTLSGDISVAKDPKICSGIW